MENEERIKITMSSVVIFVDGVCEGGDVKGEFLYMLQGTERPFSSLAGLVLALDGIMDDLGRPQRFMAQRTWDYPHVNRIRRSPKPNKTFRTAPPINRHGKVGTFILYIYIRRNATWQGEVQWVEKKKQVTFRSSLELIHLLLSACAPEAYECFRLPEETLRTMRGQPIP